MRVATSISYASGASDGAAIDGAGSRPWPTQAARPTADLAAAPGRRGAVAATARKDVDRPPQFGDAPGGRSSRLVSSPFGSPGERAPGAAGRVIGAASMRWEVSSDGSADLRIGWVTIAAGHRNGWNVLRLMSFTAGGTDRVPRDPDRGLHLEDDSHRVARAPWLRAHGEGLGSRTSSSGRTRLRRRRRGVPLAANPRAAAAAGVTLADAGSPSSRPRGRTRPAVLRDRARGRAPDGGAGRRGGEPGIDAPLGHG